MQMSAEKLGGGGGGLWTQSHGPVGRGEEGGLSPYWAYALLIMVQVLGWGERGHEVAKLQFAGVY